MRGSPLGKEPPTRVTPMNQAPTSSRKLGKYLGLSLVSVGAVFLLSPAQLLAGMTDSISLPNWGWLASMDLSGELTMSVSTWVWIILAYYFVATLLPVDKIIGKIYPLFGIALVAMAVGLLGALLVGDYTIPELTSVQKSFLISSAERQILPPPQ